MIEILVKRSPGDKLGPKITNPLITSEPVAIAAGTAAIDQSCSDRKKLSISTCSLPFTLPGGVVGVTTYKGRKVGKLKTFEKEYALSESEYTVTCRMDVEVIDD